MWGTIIGQIMQSCIAHCKDSGICPKKKQGEGVMEGSEQRNVNFSDEESSFDGLQVVKARTKGTNQGINVIIEVRDDGDSDE